MQGRGRRRRTSSTVSRRARLPLTCNSEARAAAARLLQRVGGAHAEGHARAAHRARGVALVRHRVRVHALRAHIPARRGLVTPRSPAREPQRPAACSLTRKPPCPAGPLESPPRPAASHGAGAGRTAWQRRSAAARRWCTRTGTAVPFLLRTRQHAPVQQRLAAGSWQGRARHACACCAQPQARQHHARAGPPQQHAHAGRRAAQGARRPGAARRFRCGRWRGPRT